MTNVPAFPDFKPLGIEDRDFLHDLLWSYQPKTSELTFTNLFIWRDAYDLQWSMHQECLLLLGQDGRGEPYGFPVVGSGSRLEVTYTFLDWLREEHGVSVPRLERADGQLVADLEGDARFAIDPTPDHFDYVYDREDLATLAGRGYSNKRNHINYFTRRHEYTYEPLSPDNIEACVRVACEWCEKYRCEDDMNLIEERDAVRESLENFTLLRAQGGVIYVEGRIEAFSVGEMLNEETLVVHIEKADPDIRGLYQLINQEFVQHCCTEATWVNREQDLGVPGLRRAKHSYHPDHMVEKYRIRLVE
ncbi:MAG: DUF2156 domain-containing protein [Anaerolineales bacterium]